MIKAFLIPLLESILLEIRDPNALTLSVNFDGSNKNFLKIWTNSNKNKIMISIINQESFIDYEQVCKNFMIELVKGSLLKKIILSKKN